MKRLSRIISMGVVLVLVGCQPNHQPESPAVTHSSKITLRFSGWQSNPNEGKLLAQVIQEFETSHPNIDIRYEAINSEYMDVMRTRLIGDVAPDVFYLEAFAAPQLIKYEVLEPLNTYITPDFDLKDIEPTLLGGFQQGQTIYGIPKDFSTLALFYNQQAFAEAGIAQPPKTWEELRAVAKELTVDTNKDGIPERYGLGLTPELARQTFMIKAFGGNLNDANGYATFADPASLTGLQWVVDQYQRDRTAAQPTDVGATWGSEMFGQGKAAMVIEGPWSIPYLRETFPQLDFGTAEVPAVNGKQGTMAYTVAYVINRKSKHKAAAWTFIAYLTSKQGMKRWAQQGLALPSRRLLLADLGYESDPVYVPFVQGASYATLWQTTETLPIFSTHFNNQFISALLGEQPLPQAMQTAQDQANQDIGWMR